MYDPKSGKLTHISTCFSTHHLMFAEDANNTLWTSGGGQVVGWLNTKMFDETGDEEKSQGWTALILDTNGNGKRDDYVEPNQPVDPAKDKRFGSAFYAVVAGAGRIGVGFGARFSGRDRAPRSPGRNPPKPRSRRSIEPPLNNPASGAGFLAARHGHRSQRRRVGGTRQRPHGELRSAQVQGPAQRSDRNRPALSRRVDVLHGAAAAAEGRHRLRAARRRATTRGSISSTRPAWARTRRSTPATRPRALLALKDGKFVVLRVPYPTGFYTKWMDGRIDDPKAGWKGKGLWATVSTRAPFHMETGKGTTSKVLHFQMRPDPLAR